ncbi:MAG: metallophosphoesterase family protein [Thermodesulfobacteriota bacterium]|nr:metallophosphoesterase family protein [Thermodesulfobacteriota bacterium]
MSLTGIMADSHGDVQALVAGIAALRALGCESLFHLGDICDSAYPQTTEACVALLRDHDVLAIKGNNEHTVSVNYAGQESPVVSDATALFLGRLPMVRDFAGALFAHSLPFEKELGLSAMVRTMETAEARAFFNCYPHGLLFRGHSHTPQLLWQEKGEVLTEAIAPDRPIHLVDRLPCVVTCGALVDGLCMAWHPEAACVRSIACS